MSSTEDSLFAFESTPEDAGERLDRFLARHLAPVSRSRVQAIISDGGVTLDGAQVFDRGAKVVPGHVYRVEIAPAASPEPVAEKMDLSILFEDQDLVVLDKPAGVVVHPAPGHENGTLVNALIAHCGDSLSGVGGVRRPGIVHRLDKDTTGLMVVAKNDKAHQNLSAQFAAHGRDGRMVRAYQAVVWGALERPKGKIDLPLTRSSANRKKISVARPGTGREAVTHYDVLQTFERVQNTQTSQRSARSDKNKVVASLLHLQLETGRTHQIRVHMAHIGHPLLGDAAYGQGFKASAVHLSDHAVTVLEALQRQALHAYRLGFEHPRSGEKLVFEAPLPGDMQQLIEALGDM